MRYPGALRLALGLSCALLLALGSRPAAAHGATIGARVRFEPHPAQPESRVRLVVDLSDAYDNPVDGEEVRALLARGRRAHGRPVALARVGEARYAGEISLGGAGYWTLWLDARALGARWRGKVDFTVAEGTAPPPAQAVLEHVETTGPGLWIGVASTVGLVIGAAAVWWGLRQGEGTRPGEG